jgi:hypothetical protein
VADIPAGFPDESRSPLHACVIRERRWDEHQTSPPRSATYCYDKKKEENRSERPCINEPGFAESYGRMLPISICGTSCSSHASEWTCWFLSPCYQSCLVVGLVS